MSEKQSTFTVTDRRKFTLDGELRDPASAEEIHENPPAAAITPEASPVAPLPPVSEIHTAPEAGPAEAHLTDSDLSEADAEDEFLEEQLGPVPTTQESAEQHAAYQKSSRQLDDMIRQANPGADAAPQADFEQLVQSFYLSAAIAMGAATEPGQKPRVDIIGARQSIDLLAVLLDKTKGNLTEREHKLLQTALFNLRMMFLEITNSIAAQASKSPQPGSSIQR
jgi:Domain of unknown function (DUF1844)